MKKHIYLLWALMPMLLQAQEAPVYQEINTPESGVKVFKASDYISFSLGFEFKATATDNLHAYIYKGTQDYAAATYQNYVDPATTPINKNLPVGSLPGSFNVSGTGAATYQIPVELPVASVDLMPSISLGYSSQSGNGNAGIGWHLQGFSAITRVSKNNYHDSQRQNITFTPDDAIALDGQRLIYLEGAPHGTTGAVYATEQENYMRITKTNNGYLATLKNGTTMEFGYTPDARKLQATDENQELGWLLNKVTDLYGNYYTIHYKNFGFGEVLPEYISYSGNDLYNIDPYNQVRFSYMDRDDKTTRYVSGKELKTTKLLSTIHVLSNGKTYRKYLLKYFFDHISKLNQVAVTGVNGIQYNPTIIGWKQNKYEHYLYDNYQYFSNGTQIYWYGDVDGNGKQDQAIFYAPPNRNRDQYPDFFWKIYFNDLKHRYDTSNFLYNNARALDIEQFAGTMYPTKYNNIIGGNDFNGDNYDDLLRIGEERESYQFYKPLILDHTGDTLEAVHYAPNEDYKPLLADFDGDGRTDVITYFEDTTIIPSNPAYREFQFQLTLFKADQVINSSYNLLVKSTPDLNMQLGDYNGNGKIDILLFGEDEINIVAYNNTANTLDKIKTIPTDPVLDPTLQYHVGDFNGDGNIDYIKLDIGTPYNYTVNPYDSAITPVFITAPYYNSYVYLSNGVNFEQSNDIQFDFITTNDTICLNNLHFIDINGDGRTDLFHQVPTKMYENNPYSVEECASYWYYNYPGNMHTIEKQQPLGVPEAQQLVYIGPHNNRNNMGDIDGDGRIDFIVNQADRWIFYPHHNEAENVVNSIRNGLGAETKIEYQNNTDEDMRAEESVKAQQTINNSLYSHYYHQPLKVVSKIYQPDVMTEPVMTYKYGRMAYNKEMGVIGYRIQQTFNHRDSTLTENIFNFDDQGQNYNMYLSASVSSLIQPNGSYLPVAETNYHYYPTTELANKRYYQQIQTVVDTNFITKSGSTTHYTYHPQGEIAQQTRTVYDKNGNQYAQTSSNYTYTTLGNSAYNNALASKTVTSTYKTETQETVTTQYLYDGVWLDKQILNPGSNKQISTQYIYYPSNHKLKHTITTTTDTDPDGNPYAPRISATLVYDHLSRFVTSQTNALGHTTTTEWDQTLGVPTTVTNAISQTTTMQYNGFGTLLKTTDAFGNKAEQRTHWYTDSQYPNAYYYTQSIADNAPTQRNYADKLGRTIATETATINGQWIKTKQAYNQKGQLSASYLPSFDDDNTLANTYAYDNLGRLRKTNFANRITQHMSYYSGQTVNQVTVTIAPTEIAGQPSVDPGETMPIINKIKTDKAGKTIETSNNLDQETQYQYNSFGLAKSMTTHGNSINLAYDSLGRQTSLSDPNTGTVQYQYNAFGQLKTQTNADGQQSKLYYDVLGRVSRMETPDRTINYTYDPEHAPGALAEVTDGQGNTTTYTYTEKGQLHTQTETIAGQNYTHTNSYYPDGKLHTYAYPDGFTLAYNYDQYGNLISIKNHNTQQLLWELISANAHGNITQYQYGNGITTTNTYDIYGILTNIKAGDVVDKKYLFEKGTGNLLLRKDNKYQKQEQFTYDKLSRLTHVNKNNVNPLIVAYAENGNIQSKSDVGVYSYTSSKPHALTGINTHQDTTNANLMRLQTAEYNHNQDLKWIKEYVLEDGEYEQTFSYNALNQRNYSQLTLNNQTIQEKTYVGDYELISDATTGETKAYHYITAPSGLLGVYVQNTDGTGNMLYTHQDYLGSIIAISDEAGTLQQELSYDAWGRPRRADNHSYDNVATPLLDRGYTLHEHLPQFGLIHMNGRLYDPQVGRMLSPDNDVQDANNDQNYNRYSYVLNNPLKYTDPSGENYDYGDWANGGVHGGNVDMPQGGTMDGIILSPTMQRRLMARAKEMGFMIDDGRASFVQYIGENGERVGGLGYTNSNGDVQLSGGNRVVDGRMYFEAANFEKSNISGDEWRYEKSLGHIKTNYFGNEGASPLGLYSVAVNSSQSGNDWGHTVSQALGTASVFTGGLANSYKLNANYQFKYGQGAKSADLLSKAHKTNSLKIATRFSRMGTGLAMLSAGVTIADGISNGWENHHTADLAINATIYGTALAFPIVGWIAGGAYFLTDLAVQGYTGKSITENLFD